MPRDTAHTTRGRREATSGNGEDTEHPPTTADAPRAVNAGLAAAARPSRRAAPETEAHSEALPASAAVAVEVAGHPPVETPKPAPFVVGNGTRVRTARRIVQGADILNPESGIPKEALWAQRTMAATKFHLALDEAKTQLTLIKDLVPEKPLPEKIFGTVLQPTGAPANRVQVEVEVSRPGLPVER